MELGSESFRLSFLGFRVSSPPQVDRIWSIGDLLKMYPKPYSIYLTGAVKPQRKIVHPECETKNPSPDLPSIGFRVPLNPKPTML